MNYCYDLTRRTGKALVRNRRKEELYYIESYGKWYVNDTVNFRWVPNFFVQLNINHSGDLNKNLVLGL